MGLLDLDRVLAEAREPTSFGDARLYCVGSPVDTETGEPIAVDARGFHGANPREIVRELCDKYCGDVVFVICRRGGTVVYRPPFSELSVFYFVNGSQITCWLGDVVPAELEPGDRFDGDYLATYLAHECVIDARTGFAGMVEVKSGTFVEFGSDGLVVGTVDVLPATRVRPPYRSFEEEVAAVRTLVLAAVRHKTADFRQPFSITCSGGLDSSTLAAAAWVAQRRRPGMHLINTRREAAPATDERLYFELVAQALHAEPTLVDEAAHRADLGGRLLRPTARPSRLTAAIGMQWRTHTAAASAGSKVLVTGNGGDQVFANVGPHVWDREVVAESASLREAVAAAAGLAIASHDSVWRVVREIVTRREARKLVRCLATMTGSWCSNWDRMSPSRTFQLVALRMAEMDRITFRDADVVVRNPYLFWPLITRCLAMKRSYHGWNGENRAVGRAAFAAELPDAITHRYGKQGERSLAELFDYPALAEAVWDSELVHRGLVNRAELEKALRPPITDDDAWLVIRARTVVDWIGLYQ